MLCINSHKLLNRWNVNILKYSVMFMTATRYSLKISVKVNVYFYGEFTDIIIFINFVLMIHRLGSH